MLALRIYDGFEPLVSDAVSMPLGQEIGGGIEVVATSSNDEVTTGWSTVDFCKSMHRTNRYDPGSCIDIVWTVQPKGDPPGPP